jgi:hypothetical protein
MQKQSAQDGSTDTSIKDLGVAPHQAPHGLANLENHRLMSGSIS